MATQCSAVANRRALPSDYYSEKKITVTPLDFVRNCRAPHPQSALATIAGTTPQQKYFCASNFRRENPHDVEMPMN